MPTPKNSADNRGIIEAAFAAIARDGKFVFIQEGGKNARGLWCLPGGHVDEGEAPDQAAAREAKEECGYEVTIDRLIEVREIAGTEYLGADADIDKIIHTHFYKATIIGGELTTKHAEELDGQWFSLDELKQKPMRCSWLANFLSNIDS